MTAAKMRNFSARVQPDSSRVRYRVEHGKINTVCTRAYVLFCLSHKSYNHNSSLLTGKVDLINEQK